MESLQEILGKFPQGMRADEKFSIIIIIILHTCEWNSWDLVYYKFKRILFIRSQYHFCYHRKL
jgi:hypothetical protein